MLLFLAVAVRALAAPHPAPLRRGTRSTPPKSHADHACRAAPSSRAYAAGELYPHGSSTATASRPASRTPTPRPSAGRRCSRCARVASLARGALDRARVGFLFGLWYLLSVVYSVKNKQAHMALALPNLIATAQLVVGSVIALFWWATKARARADADGGGACARRADRALPRRRPPDGRVRDGGGLASGFVQVVKSGGPVWAAIPSGLLLRQSVSRRVWLSRRRSGRGIALASAKELAFVWSAFLAAAASDIALALRNALEGVDEPAAGGEHDAGRAPSTSSPASRASSARCRSPPRSRRAAPRRRGRRRRAPPPTPPRCRRLIAAGGLYFTAYARCSSSRSNISPVTHAVGNTMRRA